jgi:cation:H+ antiporter
MWIISVKLLIMLLLILLASELFTNALEHLGERWKVSEGVTGSLFAAVGTALPETMVPILAIVGHAQGLSAGHDIGVGAILGAPLMLCTLSMGLMALSVLKQRGLNGKINAEKSGLRRDLQFFIASYIIAGGALWLPNILILKITVGFILVGTYMVYVAQTLRASSGLVNHGHATQSDSPLLISRLGCPPNKYWSMYLQLIVALALLIIAAQGFIQGIEAVSKEFGVSVLLLSLMVIPIATELPEKVNSILWIRKNKDTLAFGNITGAMVFQGSLLPAMGIIFTPWEPKMLIITGMTITLCSALWIHYHAHNKKQGLRLWHVLIGLGFYTTYLYLGLNLVSE